MRKRRMHAGSLTPAATAVAPAKASARFSAPPLLQRQVDPSYSAPRPVEKNGQVNQSASYAVAGIIPEGSRETSAELKVIPPGASVTPPSGHRLLCFLYPEGTGVRFSPTIGQLFLSSSDVDRDYGSLKRRAEPMLAPYRSASVESAAASNSVREAVAPAVTTDSEAGEAPGAMDVAAEVRSDAADAGTRTKEEVSLAHRGEGEAEAAKTAEAANLDGAISAVRNRAAGMSAHRPAEVPIASAQAAAIETSTEQSRSAATATVANLDAAKEGTSEVRRDEFKRTLKAALEAATPEPKSESEAERVMETGARTASDTLRGALTTEQNTAVGPLQSVENAEVSPATQESPPETNLELEPVGPPPAPVPAAPVVPASLPPERLDYSSDRAPADSLMAENSVTQEQLEQGNDPAFGPALEVRTTAETNEAAAEARYRQSESNLQQRTEGAAHEALAQGLGGLHGARAMHIGQVAGQQLSTLGKEAVERQRITDHINAVKNKTKTDVDAILTEMETETTRLFEDGLKRAEKAYEAAFEEAKGGVGTWLTTWGSDWEEHIEESLATARRKYLEEVDTAIDEVANCVDQKLEAARQRVTDGRREVEAFVKGLDGSVKQFGEEALGAVRSDFDALSTEIDQRRDGLINKLTEQYKSSYDRMSAREEQLRAENKSLWQRVYDATVGVVEQIIAFKNLLLNVLAKAADAVGLIIADPIGFLGNLVEGVKLGVKGFVNNIGTYLKNGLFEWLFGTLAAAGLKLPAQFDLRGFLDLVLQVLGLTYANFRKRAVNIVGEEVVSQIEKVSEIFKILVTEGPAGLWNYIKEQVSGMIAALIDGIKSFLIEKVIIAGVTWVVGLLNPASAFFKACKAIYDIVMFFIERGRQILALVNAVIDSITAIAKGSLSGAAQFVENALAKGIPVAIGFLASLLGLGGLSDKIKELIEKIQAPINKAIDWIIHKAVALVKKAGQLLGFGEKESKNGDEDSQSSAVKAEAAQSVLEKKGTYDSFESMGALFSDIYSELKPEGLDFIGLIPDRDGGYFIGVSASAVDRIAKVKALEEKLYRLPKLVYAFVQINGVLNEITYWNRGKEVHAEDELIRDFPNIIKRHESRFGTPIRTVSLTIRYSPCLDRCSVNLIRLKDSADIPGSAQWNIYYVQLYGHVDSKSARVREEFDKTSEEAVQMLQDADFGVTIFDDKTSFAKARQGQPQ